MTKTDFAELFVQRTADECVALMHDWSTSYELFERALRTYVYERFHIDPANLQSDDFGILAEESITIMLEERAQGKIADTPSLTCDGADSAEMKRILLIVVLQKKLGVKVDPDDSVDLITIPKLARELFRLVHAG